MTMHRCSNCQSENRAEARFCKRCGFWLLPNCPFCNTTLPEAALFCDHCGRHLNTQLGSTPRALDPWPPSPPVTSHSSQELPTPSGFPLNESKNPTPSAVATSELHQYIP